LSSDIADEYVKVAKVLANDFPGIAINPVLTLILGDESGHYENGRQVNFQSHVPISPKSLK